MLLQKRFKQNFAIDLKNLKITQQIDNADTKYLISFFLMSVLIEAGIW